MFEFINSILVSVAEKGYSVALYNAFNTVAVCAAVVFSFWYGKKLKIPFFHRPILSLAQVCSMSAVMTLELWMESGFSNFDRKENAVAYVYIPIIALLYSKISKLSFVKIADMMAFTPLIMYCFARIGCMFAGCCYGYAREWGIYNMRVEGKLFPVQLLEIFLTIIIILSLIMISRKQHYNSKGTLLPLMLIIYGVVRFFTEFLHNNNKIWMKLSSMSFHSLFMIIIGVILLFIIKKRAIKKEVENQSKGEALYAS